MPPKSMNGALRCAIVLLALLAPRTIRAEPPRSPNVIILLVDDLGYHDLGFQGSEEIKTPHLDKLAAGGTVFTDAHVSASVCSPSRAGLLTGRYQQRFGHEANSPPKSHGMDPAETTIADAFQKLGYHTGAIGKWHVGSGEAQYPTRRGFDDFWGLREGHRSYWYRPKRDDKAGSHKAIEHNGSPVRFEGYLTDWMGDTAVNYIGEHAKDPFFLYLAFTAPHGPIEAKPEDLKLLKTDNEYAAMIYAVDRAVGRIIDALERENLMENTLIWFLSDNGGVAKQASNAPLKGKKGTAYEGGNRVPFFLHWKGQVPAGRRDPRLVLSLDIFPTSLRAAGGTPPSERPLDGVDLLPFLREKTGESPHPTAHWRRMNIASTRRGPWKLIRVEDLGEALYNLDEDLGETNNLIDSRPKVAASLRRNFEQWQQGLVTPLWREGAKWDRKRFEDHQAYFENRALR